MQNYIDGVGMKKILNTNKNENTKTKGILSRGG